MSALECLFVSRRLVLLTLFLVWGAACVGQPATCTPAREERSFRFRDHAIRLDVLRPAKRGRYPVIIVLHGAGGLYSPELNDGSKDNFGEHQLACSGRIAVLVHYLDASQARFASPDLIRRDAQVWLELVKDAVGVVAKLPFAAHDDLNFLGESLGGYLGLAVALGDRRIKRVFIVSGGFAEAYTDTIANRPQVVMYHGSDDSVISLESAQKGCAALRVRGIKCTLHVLPRTEHVLPADSIRSIVDEVIRLTSAQLVEAVPK